MLLRIYTNYLLIFNFFNCLKIEEYLKEENKNEGVDFNKRIFLKLEISVIIDYSIFQKWLYEHNNNPVEATINIQNFYTNLFHLLEERMKILSFNEVSIQSRLVGLDIATSRDVVPYIESQEGLKKGGNTLDGEAAITKYWHSIGVDKNTSDLIIIFTNYELGNANGMSFERSICHSNAVSLVRENSTNNLLNTLSHEISHIIGSGHDGEGNNCQSKKQYLMAPFRYRPSNHSYDLNFLHLSPCSKKSIRKYLRKLEK